jgi:hypothetical protein
MLVGPVGGVLHFLYFPSFFFLFFLGGRGEGDSVCLGGEYFLLQGEGSSEDRGGGGGCAEFYDLDDWLP